MCFPRKLGFIIKQIKMYPNAGQTSFIIYRVENRLSAYSIRFSLQRNNMAPIPQTMHKVSYRQPDINFCISTDKDISSEESRRSYLKRQVSKREGH